MSSKKLKVKEALSQFSDIGKHEIVTVFSSEGKILASEYAVGFLADGVPERMEKLGISTNDIVKAMNFGELEQMLVEGEKRKLLIHRDSDHGFFVALGGRKNLSVGLARITMKDVMNKLRSILKEKE